MQELADWKPFMDALPKKNFAKLNCFVGKTGRPPSSPMLCHNFCSYFLPNVVHYFLIQSSGTIFCKLYPEESFLGLKRGSITDSLKSGLSPRILDASDSDFGSYD
ncbi:hypothetical protein S83_032472 [Arachis hypogaea]